MPQTGYGNVTDGPMDENYTWKHDTNEMDNGCFHTIPTTEHMFKGELNISQVQFHMVDELLIYSKSTFCQGYPMMGADMLKRHRFVRSLWALYIYID